MASYKDLQKQISTLQRQAEDVRKKEVANAMADIRAKMDEFGLSVEDLGKKTAKTTRTKASAGKKKAKATAKSTVAAPRAAKPAAGPKPKYQDPASGATWSGRGRKPGWIIAALEAGQSIDTFLIK